MIYDAVVVGLGGMGSAAVAEIARRGRRVVGLEQFGRAHELGSSAGRSRIIRMAYYEDPAYVPLLQRAYERWAQLAAETATELLSMCGLLMVGGRQSRVISGAVKSARRHAIPIEELERNELLRRYPALRLREDERGIFEPNAGMVFPEAAIEAHLQVAQRWGAELRFDTAVRQFVSGRDEISVEVVDGSVVRARSLAICAGPWLAQVAHELALPVRVQRNVQVWFAPARADYAIDRFPVFLLDRAGAAAALYGFPDYGAGVKAAFHGYGDSTSPQRLDRAVHAEDIEPVRSALDDWMPGAAAELRDAKVCMYTLTPDEHFIVDRHPRDPRIILAGGFSGHGYKFCPVIGEIVADLVVDRATRHEIGFLRLERLSASA